MKNFLPIAVGIIGVGLSFLALINWAKTNIDDRDHAIHLAELRGQFAADAGWVRTTPDDKKYPAEVKQLLSRYFKKLDEVYRADGRTLDVEEWKKRWAADKAKDKLTEKQVKNEEDFHQAYELTKRIFEMFRSATFEPRITLEDGGTRMDVYNVSTENVQGSELVVWDYVLWGSNGEPRCNFKMEIFTKEILEMIEKKKQEEADIAAGKKPAPKPPPAKKKGEKDEPEEQKTLGMRVEGDCNPMMGVANPPAYIKEFPPGVIIGRFALPKVPANTEKVNIDFSVKRAGYVGSFPVEWKIEEMDVEPSWKLPPGSEWKSQVIEQPAE